MHFETALNCLWLALGLVALACTIRARVSKTSLRGSAPAWLHVCGTALIVAALFPYISATDDILRIQQVNAQHDKQHSGKKTASDELVRLYEAMDTPLVCQVQRILLRLIFVCLVVVATVIGRSRVAPFESGRSPPAFA